jgi:hypothetical protein
MTTTIAQYYKVELFDWNNSIRFYTREIAELGNKLADVIRRDSIVGIAKKVEGHQSLLNYSSGKFHDLQLAIKQQAALLKKSEFPALDHSTENETERKRNELRSMMQATVKEYIDANFNCYHFLSEIIKKNYGKRNILPELWYAPG